MCPHHWACACYVRHVCGPLPPALKKLHPYDDMNAQLCTLYAMTTRTPCRKCSPTSARRSLMRSSARLRRFSDRCCSENLTFSVRTLGLSSLLLGRRCLYLFRYSRRFRASCGTFCRSVFGYPLACSARCTSSMRTS